MFMSRLRVKAGKKAYGIIKDGGFSFDLVSAYFGAAVGPRCLSPAGLTRRFCQRNFSAPKSLCS